MKAPLHAVRPRVPRTRQGAFLGALAVAVNVLLQGAFRPADAEPARRPALLPTQDFVPLADAAIARDGLPRTLAAPMSLRTDVAWIELTLTSDLIEHFHRSAATTSLVDVGNSILLLPEAFLDDTLRLVAGVLPRPNPLPRSGDASTGITAKLFDIQPGPREGRLFSAFLSSWVEREASLLTRLSDADVDSGGVEDLDVHGLLRDQGKILWDAVRQTYRSKYRIRGEERIRDDAFQLSEWRGADFAVLPPLVLGYLWWRGLEKRVSIGDTWLGISIQPPSDWVSGSEDVVAGVSVEWGIKGFPVGLILSVGRYDGSSELDFVGLGTSVSMVRQALGVRLPY